MYLVDFRKERQVEIMNAIKTGGPIPAPPRGWTRYEMLQVASAMYGGLLAEGPVTSELMLLEILPIGDRGEETLAQDVHDAIVFCDQLTSMLSDGKYDEHYEPHIQAG